MIKTTNKFFNAAKTGDVLAISIYGAIGADMFGDGISAQTVSDALKPACKSITVHLNSPGGSAFDGVAIYNLLKASAKPVNVIVEGMAASAASIIAMAGDTITMATGSVLMIHEAMSMAFGNADAMTKMADTLTTVTSGIADIYVAKTGLPKAEILDMQNVETWMTADEAVAKGFATGVSKTSAVKNEFKLDAFSNVPTSLTVVAAAADPAQCACDCAQCTAGECGICSDDDCTDDVCDCANQPGNKAEPIVNEAPDLSLFAHQLEINKRK
jgi:ATP-dependent Clp protease protease subunit